MAESSPTYPLVVDGVGEFVFYRRNMRRQIAIEVEVARLTEGVSVTGNLAVFIEALATIKALTAESPSSWNPSESDPFDPESWERVVKVGAALREKEVNFRSGPKGSGAGASSTDEGESGILVPAPIQPPSNGPAVS
jgi:hypothetical protein